MKDVLLVSAGFAIGNYVVHFLTDGSYSAALERSFFQAFALLWFYWLNREKWVTK